MTPEELRLRIRAAPVESLSACKDGTITTAEEKAEDEEEELDDLWQALLLLGEAQGELKYILDRDFIENFLTAKKAKEMGDLVQAIEDLVEQYDLTTE
jgi:hypothetical protein